jgi:hypothetical protein
MAGIRPVFEKGPLTFAATTTANGGTISGGKFVIPDGTTGRIRVCNAAGATNVIGLATGDAAPSDYSNADTADPWGNPVVNAQFPPNEVAVAYQGVWRVRNSSGATIPFGALVVASAVGEAQARAAETMDAVVGKCVEPGGIAAGARGKILLGTVGG